MVIDISTTSYPHLSYRDEYKVKGNKLLTELKSEVNAVINLNKY